jgi:ketosteroid isomerase-like protein
MKKLLTGLLAITCFFACNTKTDSNNADVANSNADKTKMVYHTLETGDAKGLDSIFSDDVLDHNGGPNGEDLTGKQNVIAEISKMHDYFDGLKMEMLQHATSPDGVYHYATMRMTGTAKQNPWGMPVGMQVDHTGVDLVKMKDGKCTEHWGFMSMKDVNAMMKGMGDQKPAMDSAKVKK